MEHQNIAYFSQEVDHDQSAGVGSQGQYHSGRADFRQNSNQNFHVSHERNFHGATAGGRRAPFVGNSVVQPRQQHIVVQQSPVSLQQKVAVTGASGQQTVLFVPPNSGSIATSQQQQQQQQQQHIIISTQPIQQAVTPNPDPDVVPISSFLDYFCEKQEQPGCSSSISALQAVSQYRNTPIVEQKYSIKNKLEGVGGDKTEKDAVKRAKQAEAARQRYHRLTADEKKALNLKRTLAQKRKKQREKELAQLESILRASGDIYDDPDVLDQLREKRMRAKWAEAARNRYHRSMMSDEERKVRNVRRRMRQVSTTTKNKQEDVKDIVTGEDVQRRMKEQNAKKAESARQRYHRMSYDEKKMYNQRRTEAFRRRRMEEETLLAMPIGRINGEALDRAQQIVIRNAKRAEAARLRYQRMTPDQRRAYNQKRYTPKRKRQMMDMIMGSADGNDMKMEKSEGEEEFDALSSLERDVLRRTQQAQQVLLRQRGQQLPQATIALPQQQQHATIGSVAASTLTSAMFKHHVVSPSSSSSSLLGSSPRQQMVVGGGEPSTSSSSSSNLLQGQQQNSDLKSALIQQQGGGQPQQIQYITTTGGGTTSGRRVMVGGTTGVGGQQQVAYSNVQHQQQRA